MDRMPTPGPLSARPRAALTGRAAFLRLLVDEGVTHLFGNPGTTELAIMEAVPQFPELRYVMGLQESIVLAMADGYARASVPTDIAIAANVRETLAVLLPALAARQTPAQVARADRAAAAIAADNWAARRERRVATVAAREPTRPIDQDYLMWRLAEALPPDAIVVEETLTCSAALMAFLRTRERDGFYGLASGGLGFGLPGAIGVALARPGRPVVAVLGDGSSLYSIQALWTAAHLRLPIHFVIVNNRSYRIIKDRLVAMRGTDAFTGMDIRDPAIDFPALARGFGLAASEISEPAEIDAALRTALSSPGPTLTAFAVDDGYGGR